MKSPALNILAVVGVLGTSTVAMAANTDTLSGVFGGGEPVSASEGLVPANVTAPATEPALAPAPAAPALVDPVTASNGNAKNLAPAPAPGVAPAPAPAPSHGTTGGSSAAGGGDDEYEDDSHDSDHSDYEEHEHEDGDDD